MPIEAGIWIDFRKAVIVTFTGSEQETKEIRSNLDKNARFSRGSREDGASEALQDRQQINHLSSFYDEILAAIRDVESILIMGPGVIKGGLLKRLAMDKSASRIVGFETVEKMTDREVAKKVRRQFKIKKNKLRGVTHKATQGQTQSSRAGLKNNQKKKE